MTLILCLQKDHEEQEDPSALDRRPVNRCLFGQEPILISSVYLVYFGHKCYPIWRVKSIMKTTWVDYHNSNCDSDTLTFFCKEVSLEHLF